MNMANSLLNDSFITSAVFNDELVELTYMEKRDQGTKCMKIHTLMFPVDGSDPDLVEIVAIIQDHLRDLIDRVEAAQREEFQEVRKGLRQALEDRGQG